MRQQLRPLGFIYKWGWRKPPEETSFDVAEAIRNIKIDSEEETMVTAVTETQLKEANAELTKKNEDLSRLIKDFVDVYPEFESREYYSTLHYCRAEYIFRSYVERLKREKVERREEDRIRKHVEKILTDRGVIPPGPGCLQEYKDSASKG